VLVRILLTLVTFIGTFYFSFWTVGAALAGTLGLPFLLSPVVPLLIAILVTRFVWKYLKTDEPTMRASIGAGAAIVGSIAFCVGFFGPLIVPGMPPQGLLTGLFITGPAGLIAGAVAGGLRWKKRQRDEGLGQKNGRKPRKARRR